MVEHVELMEPIGGHGSVSGIGMKQPSGEGCVDFVEEFEKQQTDAISVGQELIATRVVQLFHETFGPEFPQFIAERGQRALLGRYSEGLGSRRLQFRRSESVACGHMREPYQRTHHGQLPGMVEFESGNALQRS